MRRKGWVGEGLGVIPRMPRLQATPHHLLMYVWALHCLYEHGSPRRAIAFGELGAPSKPPYEHGSPRRAIAFGELGAPSKPPCQDSQAEVCQTSELGTQN
jgi:hypothetical protein